MKTKETSIFSVCVHSDSCQSITNHELQSTVKKTNIGVCFQLPVVLCCALSRSLSMLRRQAGLFNSAVTSHEDTLENISSAAGLIIREGGGDCAGALAPSSLTFKRTHTLFPALPRCPCWKDLNTPYRHRSTPANQIMLCHDVPFPFYVNTSYQPRMCQHKLLAPLLKFRLPHYPDLSRIKLRRLE